MANYSYGSPGVTLFEDDRATVVNPQNITNGAIVFDCEWGPGDVQIVSSEADLINIYGRPTNANYKGWMCAANFLSYSNSLKCLRAINEGTLNAAQYSKDAVQIKTLDTFTAMEPMLSDSEHSSAVYARYPGRFGNKIHVTIADKDAINEITYTDQDGKLTDAEGYFIDESGMFVDENGNILNPGFRMTRDLVDEDEDNIDDEETGTTENGNTEQAEDTGTTEETGDTGTSEDTGTTEDNLDEDTGTTEEPAGSTENTGSTEEVNEPEIPELLKVKTQAMPLIEHHNRLFYYVTKIMDENDVAVGVFVENSLKEFAIYSLSKEAKQFSGLTNYLPTAVNRGSDYIFIVESKIIELKNSVGLNLDLDFSLAENTLTRADAGELPGGGTYVPASEGDYGNAWDIFTDSETYDVGLLLQGGGSLTTAKTVLSVAETRRDAIACLSPQEEDCVNLNPNLAIKNMCNTAQAIGFSSYGFMDGNYKYQYDRWNDCYRWVPLNGDIAGIFALVDNTKGPWFSPGRSSIKNTIKFAVNPTKAQRDELWKYHINPCLSFNDTGAVLYGDQTGADQSASFNFVGVRRTFLFIEKSILQYSRDIMFQQNDETSRVAFIQTMNPFLRGLVGSRAISDYRIICDTTNNTADIVDMGKFVAAIFVKPVRSTRYVEISLVSTGSDIELEEIVV